MKGFNREVWELRQRCRELQEMADFERAKANQEMSHRIQVETEFDTYRKAVENAVVDLLRGVRTYNDDIPF